MGRIGILPNYLPKSSSPSVNFGKTVRGYLGCWLLKVSWMNLGRTLMTIGVARKITVKRKIRKKLKGVQDRMTKERKYLDRLQGLASSVRWEQQQVHLCRVQ